MTNIVLSNAIRTVTLDFVVDYRISKTTRHPTKRIPNKSTPTVDPDAKTTEPRTYTISAYVTSTVATAILNMESDRQVIRLQDNDLVDDTCCFMEKPDIINRAGHTTRPWNARLLLLSSAN